jgi:hypothetical protein
MSVMVAKTTESFHVEARNGESWIRLSIQLGEAFKGGEVIHLTPDATFAIEGRDELSASYGEKNWLSGAASGAFYAYRHLRATRRIVHVTEFSGRLRSAEMEAVAAAVAWAVAGCLHAVMPWDLEGWQVQTPEPSENGKSLSPATAPPTILE